MKKCKIIFPSTHVVYEGIKKVKNDIKKMKKQNLYFLMQSKAVKTKNN